MTRLLGLVILVLLARLAPAPAAAQSPAADVATLQPGDLVRVLIWQEKDLSGEFLVDEQGKVTLPLLGERQAAGVPIPQLRESLVREYQAQLRNPSITITPLRRVNVLGEVNKPGVYPVDLTVTLLEVVGLAGGVNPQGDLRRIQIVRRDGTVLQERVRAETELLATGIRSGDQVFVGRRSWVDRNSGPLLAAVISLVGSAVSTIIIVNNQR